MGVIDAPDVAAIEQLSPAAALSFELQRATRTGAHCGIDFPPDTGTMHSAIVFGDRNRARCAYALELAASRLQPGSLLYLAGENRAGIKSRTRELGAFGKPEKRGVAAHGTLYATEVATPPPSPVLPAENVYSVTIGGVEKRICSLPGVFSAGRLDTGTELLLKHLPAKTVGHALDLGTGAGILALALTDRAEVVVAVDSDALAVEACRRTAEYNDAMIDAFLSDGFSQVHGVFDLIVTNPPFHRGRARDAATTAGWIADSGSYLSRNGTLLLVANSFLPYSESLQKTYSEVREMARSSGFVVYEARRPRRSRK